VCGDCEVAWRLRRWRGRRRGMGVQRAGGSRTRSMAARGGDGDE